MPVSPENITVDTGVLITIAAATDGWDIFDFLGVPIVITPVVWREVRQGGVGRPGVNTILRPSMEIWAGEINIPVWLNNVLDAGEASVITLALEQNWREVAIDEATGRSVARICGLRLTGSLGLLIRAKREGYAIILADAVNKIRAAGIWISKEVEESALKAAGEI